MLSGKEEAEGERGCSKGFLGLIFFPTYRTVTVGGSSMRFRDEFCEETAEFLLQNNQILA